MSEDEIRHEYEILERAKKNSQAFSELYELYFDRIFNFIYRQTDDVFIDLLNNVRNNRCSDDDIELLNKLYDPDFIPAKEEKYIFLTSHNHLADKINSRELAKLPGKS